MIKNIIHNLYLKIGKALQASLNKSGQGAATVSGINDILLNNNNQYGISYMQPYGFVSLPNDGTNIVLTSLGVNGNQTLALGCINVLPASSAISLATGESAVFSNNYVLQVTNHSVQYKYNGTTATACSGEDVQQILNDILIQLEDIYTQLGAIWGQINNHSHTVNGIATGDSSVTTSTMANSGTSLSQPPINAAIPQDQAFVAAGKILINDSGLTPVA